MEQNVLYWILGLCLVALVVFIILFAVGVGCKKCPACEETGGDGGGGGGSDPIIQGRPATMNPGLTANQPYKIYTTNTGPSALSGAGDKLALSDTTKFVTLPGLPKAQQAMGTASYGAAAAGLNVDQSTLVYLIVYATSVTDTSDTTTDFTNMGGSSNEWIMGVQRVPVTMDSNGQISFDVPSVLVPIMEPFQYNFQDVASYTFRAQLLQQLPAGLEANKLYSINDISDETRIEVTSSVYATYVSEERTVYTTGLSSTIDSVTSLTFSTTPVFTQDMETLGSYDYAVRNFNWSPTEMRTQLGYPHNASSGAFNPGIKMYLSYENQRGETTIIETDLTSNTMSGHYGVGLVFPKMAISSTASSTQVDWEQDLSATFYVQLQTAQGFSAGYAELATGSLQWNSSTSTYTIQLYSETMSMAPTINPAYHTVTIGAISPTATFTVYDKANNQTLTPAVNKYLLDMQTEGMNDQLYLHGVLYASGVQVGEATTDFGITMNMGNGDFEWDDGTGAVTSLDLDMTHVGTAQNSYDIVIYVRRYNSTTGSKDLVNDDVLLESWNGSVGTSYNRIRYVSSTTVSFRYIMSMYLDVEYYATYRLFLEDHPAGASSTETDATHVGVYEVSSTGPQVTSQFYAVSSDGLGNKYVDITNGPTVSSTDSWYFIGFSSESGVNATGEEWSHHFLVDVDGGEGYNHTATVA